jgi:hypothetical protein
VTSLEFFAVGSITFFAAGLVVYWAARVVSVLVRSDRELDELVDRDLVKARQMWAQVRRLFDPYHGLIPY